MSNRQVMRVRREVAVEPPAPKQELRFLFLGESERLAMRANGANLYQRRGCECAQFRISGLALSNAESRLVPTCLLAQLAAASAT